LSSKYDRRKSTLPSPQYDVSEHELGIDDSYINAPTDPTWLEKFPDWLRNVKTNLDTIGFEQTVLDLPEVKGSAIVVDHQMTGSLEKALTLLKNYKGTLFACDRALYKLIPYRVPEYVANLDSSYLCMSFFDRPDVREVMDKVTAIFATTTFTLTIRHWHGKRVFFTPWIGSVLTDSISAATKTPTMQTGGNVATFLWILAVALKANPIALVGIDNSVYEKRQTEYPGVPHKKAHGPYGTAYIDPVYEHYANWHLAAIRTAKNELAINTINCTEGGVMYSEDVLDMPLLDFIEKYGS